MIWKKIYLLFECETVHQLVHDSFSIFFCLIARFFAFLQHFVFSFQPTHLLFFCSRFLTHSISDSEFCFFMLSQLFWAHSFPVFYERQYTWPWTNLYRSPMFSRYWFIEWREELPFLSLSVYFSRNQSIFLVPSWSFIPFEKQITHIAIDYWQYQSSFCVNLVKFSINFCIQSQLKISSFRTLQSSSSSSQL